MNMPKLTITDEDRQRLAKDNLLFAPELREMPVPPELKAHPRGPQRAWRSAGFLVQQFEDPHPAVVARLTINRTSVFGERWVDGILWDDIQRLKAECGYGAMWAVEVFPDDAHLINDANLRHIFLLDDAPPFAWQRGQRP